MVLAAFLPLRRQQAAGLGVQLRQRDRVLAAAAVAPVGAVVSAVREVRGQLA